MKIKEIIPNIKKYFLVYSIFFLGLVAFTFLFLALTKKKEPNPTTPVQKEEGSRINPLSPLPASVYKEKINDYTEYLSNEEMFMVIDTKQKQILVKTSLAEDANLTQQKAQELLKREGYPDLTDYQYETIGTPTPDYSQIEVPSAAEIEKMYQELLENRQPPK